MGINVPDLPTSNDVALAVWARFRMKVDNGHDDFVAKADKCWDYFFGKQWLQSDKDKLKMEGRPALTINKIRPTLKTVLGEQIYNRTEIGFVARNEDASDETANVLTKVFKQISDNNRLDWLRTQMFFNGQVTSRGFIDARISFDDNMRGEVRYTLLNPKNVVIDSDADEYDPDKWSDVTHTKWLTYDDIACLYSTQDANRLENRERSDFMSYDAIDYMRNRFGRNDEPLNELAGKSYRGLLRNIRVLDHQYRKLHRQKHFVAMTGDTREVPETWDRDKIAKFIEMTGFNVITKPVRRIRWTVVADDVTLFDEWSPYKHFTVIPYFPIFAWGRSAGTVEDLLGPQDLLNKVSSQELAVMNTTANSGYYVQSGKLTNMTPDQLRSQGAQTGVVIEVTGPIDEAIQKIAPNQVPQGLDRITFKAEASIQTISGVNDSMQGFDREDVAAKAIDKKKQSGQTGLAPDLDNLAVTDYILARNTLDMIQTFYTEERIMQITTNSVTQDQEKFTINQAAAGRIINDLTIGEYGIVTTNVPARESLQDSEFEQALALRQLGVTMIDDATLVMASRLRSKGEIIRRGTEQAKTPEGQAAQQRQQRAEEAGVRKLEGEAEEKLTKAELNKAKVAETLQPESPEINDGSAMAKVNVDAQAKGAEIDQKERDMEVQHALDLREADRKDAELQIKAEDLAQKRRDAQLQQAQQAAQAALAPQPKG